MGSKLAYTEILALLIQDKIARRKQKKFALRPRRPSFRVSKALDQFDFERLPKLNRAFVHDLTTGRYLTEHASVPIVGQAGVGKSHPARALGHCAIRQGVDVPFTCWAQLTASLNVARATGAYERKLATLARVPLLVAGDSRLKPLRPPADEDLHDHDLISERYEQASTIVASNLDFSEWDQAVPNNRLLASVTVDRLCHMDVLRSIIGPLSPLRQHLPRVQDIARIECVLKGPHQRDLIGRSRAIQVVAFLQADTVLGRDR